MLDFSLPCPATWWRWFTRKGGRKENNIWFIASSEKKVHQSCSWYSTQVPDRSFLKRDTFPTRLFTTIKPRNCKMFGHEVGILESNLCFKDNKRCLILQNDLPVSSPKTPIDGFFNPKINIFEAILKNVRSGQWRCDFWLSLPAHANLPKCWIFQIIFLAEWVVFVFFSLKCTYSFKSLPDRT